jgi:hypothetical protein
VTAALGRVNQALLVVCGTAVATKSIVLLNESRERNEMALCMAKQQTYEVLKITGRLRNYYS